VIRIVEFEDFVQFMADMQLHYIEEQFADGELDCINQFHNHEEFEAFWNAVCRFREIHGLPYKCYGYRGEEITTERYYELMGIAKQRGLDALIKESLRGCLVKGKKNNWDLRKCEQCDFLLLEIQCKKFMEDKGRVKVFRDPRGEWRNLDGKKLKEEQ